MGMYGSGWYTFLAHDESKDKPVVNRELLKRVWQFAKPYQPQAIGLLITIVSISLLSLVSPMLIRDLINNAIPNKDFARLNLLAVGMIGIPIINGLFGVWQRRLSAQVGEGVIHDLRRGLYEHLQRMSLRFFTNTRTGELMSRLNSDVVGAQRAIASTFVTIIANLISFVGTIALMIYLDYRLTLLSLIIFPFFLIMARRIARRLRDIRRRSMGYNAEMNAVMNETLNVSGALLVKLFGRETLEADKFGKHAEDVRDVGIESAVTSQWFFLMLGIVSAIGTAVIFWLGGVLVLRNEFELGDMIAFTSLLGQMYNPLMSLTNAPVEFAQSMVSFERVFEVLDIPVEIEEKEGAVSLSAVKGDISFDHVFFAYEEAGKDTGLEEVKRFTWGANAAYLKRGKEGEEGDKDASVETQYALQDINFDVKAGELIALVGPSGAGKSSLTYLLPRLYDPVSGVLSIDGHDVRDVTLQSLAENIGMVTQDTYLFYDTIRANLLYANPDATEAEMMSAAKAANIHEFIVGLPDGYDMVVGERGYRLSGGERQRIAIARVILKNPRIIVLDEATSQLDSVSERLIQEALEHVMKGRTSLVIAHRLSTILAADKILVMDNGRLVEQGTHDTLLNKDGLYAELYHTQFSMT